MSAVTQHGFAPVAGIRPAVLLLGTFPGRASREAGEYYAHKQNQFWRILYAVLRTEWHDPAYAEKLDLLEQRRVALWDIVGNCETDGSADSEIKKPRLIDLSGFLREHPTVRAVCFNGAASARFAKRLGALTVDTHILPSTSPANARIRPADKLKIWSGVLSPYLCGE